MIRRIHAISYFCVSGNNAGNERVVYKNKNWTIFENQEKYGVFKEIVAHFLPQVIASAAYQKLGGPDLIVDSVPCHVQVGQVRIPLWKRYMDEIDNRSEYLAQLCVLIHHFCYENEEVRQQPSVAWNMIDFLEEASIQKTEQHMTVLIEEFNHCIKYPDHNSTIFDLNWTVRGGHDFGNNNNVKLMRVKKRRGPKGKIEVDSKPVKWEQLDRSGGRTMLSVKNGADIKIDDIVRSIRRYHDTHPQINLKVTKKNWNLCWTSATGSIFQTPIFDAIEGISYHHGNAIKLGNKVYLVNPDEGNLFYENVKFIKLLQNHLIKKVDMPSVFPLPWCFSGEAKSKSHFSLDEITNACLIDKKHYEETKTAIEQCLQDPFHILESDGAVTLFSKQGQIPPLSRDETKELRRAQLLNNSLLKKTFQFSRQLNEKEGGLLRVLSNYLLKNAVIPYKEIFEAIEKLKSKTNELNMCILQGNDDGSFICQNPIVAVQLQKFKELSIRKEKLYDFLIEKRRSGQSFNAQDLIKEKIIDEKVGAKELKNFLLRKVNLFGAKQKFYKLTPKLMQDSLMCQDFSIETLNFIKDIIDESLDLETIKKSLTELSEETKLAEKQSDGSYKIIAPYLTKDSFTYINQESLENVCFSKFIQFLRSRANLDEKDYNELYHLSNCSCHSDGWVILSGDRVIDENNIEIFDVLAIHRKKGEAYFLHVKKNADANAVRNATSQVRKCGDEVKNCLMQNNDEDAFDRFFLKACDADDSSTIHRQLLAEIIRKHFPTKEDFASALRECKIHICLALADPVVNGVQKWEELSQVDLTRSMKKLLRKEDFEVLKQEKIITEKNNTITQSFFFMTKEEFIARVKPNISKNEASRMYNEILRELSCGKKVPNFRLNEMLKKGYISKFEINQLRRFFTERVVDKAKFEILPIPTL